MTTPRDLLPQWLVHHDRLSTSSTVALTDPVADGTTLEKSTLSLLAPPSHITMVPWDDGFTPSGCSGKPGKVIRNQVRSTPGAFCVVDRAVSRETADLLYASAVKARVWGVYVPTAELSFSNQSTSDSEESTAREHSEGNDEELYRRSLARCAVQELLVNKASDVISSSDWCNTHGVAVWVIASDCDDETEYHLDYAEMVRYETNVIVPPLYGATLHVSPLRNRIDEADTRGADNEDEDFVSDFEGGGFHVNVNGLEHYRQYGYKTRLAHKLSTDALEGVSATEPGWQHVPYLYRRGILCDGEFPHFSGRVRSLPAAATTPDRLPIKRVVVGFNLFPPEIGAFVEKFPEHSNAFNKYIKVSQAAVKQAGGVGGQQQQPWSLASLRANPKQAAFLKFLAKKIKEKNVDISTLTRQTDCAGASGEPVNNASVETTSAS